MDTDSDSDDSKPDVQNVSYCTDPDSDPYFWIGPECVSIPVSEFGNVLKR